jgi:hypothetical protein
LLLAALGLEGPARVFLALAFVTFVPGWALLGHVPVVDGTARVALAVALSLTLCTAVTQALLWLRVWEPIGVLVALGGVSLAVLLARLPWPHLATRR